MAGNFGHVVVQVNEGMTLRDYFAAQVLPALWVNEQYVAMSVDQIAVASYRQADAMMEARKDQT